MKPIALLTTSFCLLSSFSAVASDTETLSLEQELLSLEDELIQATGPGMEDSLITLETDAPFINLQAPPSLSSEQPKDTTLALDTSSNLWVEEPSEEEILQEQEPSAFDAHSTQETISFKQVFSGSPFIYSALLGMSLCSITICLYSLFRIQNQSAASDLLSREIRHRLLSNNFQSASELCQSTPNLLSRIMLSALNSRKNGPSSMTENMRSEGKRATLSAWQRLNLLQDIAVIAPMLGLLGTVMGLFYAFYDLNRSLDSMNQMLDGLGVSVGTTVAGIGVAILSMILHSIAKFKLVRSFAKVESEATQLANLIDTKN